MLACYIPASEMTYIVSGGALNSIHSLAMLYRPTYRYVHRIPNLSARAVCMRIAAGLTGVLAVCLSIFQKTLQSTTL